MPNQLIKNNFNAGEWSPNMDGRSDMERYRSACRRFRNCFALMTGPGEMRPGTYYKGEVKDSSQATRLIPFIYSNQTAYQIEAGPNYFRFWTQGGVQVMYLGIPYEIYSPYAETDLPKLNAKVQSFDIVYLFHPLHHPKKLQRYGETDWRLEDLDIKDGPFLPENTDQSVMITPSATTGSAITLTASSIKANNTTGPWGAAVTGNWAPFGTYKYTALKFTAPTGAIALRKVRTYYESAHATTVNTLTCYLYSQSGSSPGTKLSTATNTQKVGGDDKAGLRYWYFNDVAITPATVYWIVIASNAVQSAIKQQYTAHNASYGTGSASAITSITDSATTEANIEITYTKAGTASVFNEGHVGALWRCRHGGQKAIKNINTDNLFTSELTLYGKFTVIVTSRSGNPFEGRLVLQKSFDSGAVWYDVAEFAYTTKQEFFEDKIGVLYRLGCLTGDKLYGAATCELNQVDHWGVARITEYTSATVVVATVISPFGATTATPVWREGAWSDYRGFPQAGAFHEDRLWAAGTTYQPTNVWSSWTGKYEQFMPGDTANAALDLLLSSPNNPIQWLASYTEFMVGTLGEEVRMKQGDKPLTNDQLPKVIVQGYTGSAMGLQPIKAGPSLIFTQQHRKKILETRFDLQEDRFKPDNLVKLANHILEAGVVDIDFHKEPTPAVLCVLGDGTMAVLTYFREEEVMGWSLWDTDGDIESVSVIPSDLGASTGYSEVWFIVERDINGTTKRFIEILANDESVTTTADYHRVDCGIVYSGTAATSITGLNHLAGEAVKVLADGVDVSPETVGTAAVYSMGDIFSTDCSTITDWTDISSGGTAVVSSGAFLFSVPTGAFNNAAYIYITTMSSLSSSEPSRVTIGMTLTPHGLGNYGSVNYWQMKFGRTDYNLTMFLNADGMRVVTGGSGSVSLLTGPTITDNVAARWVWDWNADAKTLDVYKNDVKVVNAYADVWDTAYATRGLFTLALWGYATSGQTMTVDDIKVGTDRSTLDGTITLATAAAKVHAGLSYDCYIEPMRLEAGPGPQTVRRKLKRIVEAIPSFCRTLQGVSTPSVGPATEDIKHAIAPWVTCSGDDPVDVPFHPKWDTDRTGRVAFKQSSPVPMTIVSLVSDVEFED